MKFSEYLKTTTLHEGVWAAPQTYNQAQQLANLFRQPITARRGTNVLYNLMGDDELFDAIDEVEEKDGGDTDIRPLVAYHLGRWIKDFDFRKKPTDMGSIEDRENFGWNDPWDPKAIGLLKRLVSNWSP